MVRATSCLRQEVGYYADYVGLSMNTWTGGTFCWTGGNLCATGGNCCSTGVVICVTEGIYYVTGMAPVRCQVDPVMYKMCPVALQFYQPTRKSLTLDAVSGPAVCPQHA